MSALVTGVEPSGPCSGQTASALQKNESPASPRFYRVVWRWHFYAGLFVAPVLMIMAATGALYVFKDEIENVVHADIKLVKIGSTRATIDQQFAAARAAAPDDYHVHQFEIPADPSAAAVFYAHDPDHRDFRRLFVDPYTGAYLGELTDGDFFAVVLKIHRTLFVGTPGRVVVELVTCWTIVLLMTGAYLWWPRKGAKIGGVWLPRLWRHPYVLLRDLHAVSGVYIAGVALLIAGTGLLYSLVWGTAYNFTAAQSGAYDIFLNPPRSKSPADEPRASLERLVAAVSEALPGNTLSISLPEEPGGAVVAFGSSRIGPSSDGVVIIDHATAEVLAQRKTSEYPVMGWWVSWNYPLHVGSVLGALTKVIWLAVCIVLILLPITGLGMWWQRRPSGRTGFPRRTDARIPNWLWAGIVALSLALPMLGLSLALILMGEFVASRIGRRWNGSP